MSMRRIRMMIQIAMTGRGRRAIRMTESGGEGACRQDRIGFDDKLPLMTRLLIRFSPPTSIVMTRDSWIHLYRPNSISPVRTPCCLQITSVKCVRVIASC